MSGLAKRLALTVVALPTVYALSAVLTGYHHLAMCVVVALMMAGGAVETGGLLRASGLPSSRVLLPVAAGTVCIAAYLEGAAILPAGAALLWVSFLLAAVLVHSVVAAERQPLSMGLSRVAAFSVQLLYPALFGSYICRIADLDGSPMRYLLFYCMVFGNDTAAYIAGRAAGGRTLLGIKASPTKTGAGYAAGFVVAVGMAALFWVAFRGDFPYPLWVMCLLGGVIALATFAGDLAESALKRSGGVKDSGAIMLGRGGILDSVDSLVMSAPVYYLFFRLLGA